MTLAERVAQLEREVAELREAVQPEKLIKHAWLIYEDQKEVEVPEGFKLLNVVAKEEKEVGIEHVADPENCDFLYNYYEGALKPTRRLKKGSELSLTFISI
ncbi:MAG: hypothetical protein HGA27_00410 [Peptococcaceae bacterium]|nr:hypothetical protein [Peptococcaceae bacterium]